MGMDDDGLWYLRGRLVEALARRDWRTIERLWDAHCGEPPVQHFFRDLIFLYTGRHWERGQPPVHYPHEPGAWPV